MCRNIPFQLPEMLLNVTMSVRLSCVKLASIPVVIGVVLLSWSVKSHFTFPRGSVGLQLIVAVKPISIGWLSGTVILMMPLEKTRCDCNKLFFIA